MNYSVVSLGPEEGEDRDLTNSDGVDVLSTSSSEFESLTVPPPPLLTAQFTPLTPRDIVGLRTFVLFVGFGKTGHSIVGSLLDAHPDIIIAHEYSALKDISKAFTSQKDWLLKLFNRLYENSHRAVMEGWRSETNDKKGYNLGVTTGKSWQGRFRQLRVIGDKSGFKTVKEHLTDQNRSSCLVKELNRTLGVPVVGIRMVRNPYDTIVTRVLIANGGTNGLKRAKNTNLSRSSAAALDAQMRTVFQQMLQASRVASQLPIPIHTMHLVDLINQPRSVMRELCEVVQVECYSDYLDSCEDKVFKNLSKTRSLVQWSQKQIETVAKIMKRYPEYSRYSFDCDC